MKWLAGLVAVCLAMGASGVVLDAHAFSQDCSGSHCTLTANFRLTDKSLSSLTSLDFGDYSGAMLHAALSMSTEAVPYGITSTSGREPMICGEEFTVPIEADGEIAGHAVQFWDSPPILFEPNGILRAVTQGLTLCAARIRQDDQAAQQTGFCSNNAPNDFAGSRALADSRLDLIGTWQDSWQAFTDGGSGIYSAPAPDVTCQTASSGTRARCNSSPGRSGKIRLELTRTAEFSPGVWEAVQEGSPWWCNNIKNLPFYYSKQQPVACASVSRITLPMTSSVYVECTPTGGTIPTPRPPTPTPTPTPTLTPTPSPTPELTVTFPTPPLLTPTPTMTLAPIFSPAPTQEPTLTLTFPTPTPTLTPTPTPTPSPSPWWGFLTPSYWRQRTPALDPVVADPAPPWWKFWVPSYWRRSKPAPVIHVLPPVATAQPVVSALPRDYDSAWQVTIVGVEIQALAPEAGYTSVTVRSNYPDVVQSLNVRDGEHHWLVNDAAGMLIHESSSPYALFSVYRDGEYAVRLEVRDSTGYSSKATATLEIRNGTARLLDHSNPEN